MTEHAKIKADFASYEQELARGGNAAGVAQEMAKHARVAASEPDKLPVNLAVWGGVHDVVTRHRGALRGKLDAAAVLRSIDASTRAALANVRADLEATRVGPRPRDSRDAFARAPSPRSAVDLTAAKRSARVLSFLATRYAGLTALLVDEGAAPAFAALLVGAHQVLEAARPSEARDGARETLLGTLDAAALRVAIALGGPFLRGVAATRPRGAATHADAVAAGRGAALLRLALAHGSELVELYPADAPSPLANDVLQTAVAACLATDAPDFALFARPAASGLLFPPRRASMGTRRPIASSAGRRQRGAPAPRGEAAPHGRRRRAAALRERGRPARARTRVAPLDRVPRGLRPAAAGACASPFALLISLRRSSSSSSSRPRATRTSSTARSSTSTRPAREC